jgi:RNA polymerase sigma-70 factor, ECF subfamily
MRAPDSIFEETVIRHHKVLHRTAVRLTKKTQDAEDLVQETYLRAWRSFHTYAPGTNPKAWLFRILRNVNIDRHRADARSCSATVDYDAHHPIFASQETPESLVDARLIGADLQRALMALSDQFRRCVVLVDIRGKSYRDVANTLGVPIGTVMSRLNRSRVFIRRVLVPAARGHAATPGRPGHMQEVREAS